MSNHDDTWLELGRPRDRAPAATWQSTSAFACAARRRTSGSHGGADSCILLRIAVSLSDTTRSADRRYHLESVARAIALLKFFASASRPLVLRDVVDELGWSKPVAYRLLHTLSVTGGLRQSSGAYVLGPAMLTIGQAALRATNLPEIAKPHLERLNQEIHETVNVTVLDDDEIVYVQRIEDTQIIGVRVGIGSRLPAYCTSMGQVLLGGLPDDEIKRRLGTRPLKRRGPNTLTTVDRVLKRVREVRKHGHSINDEELAPGHRSAGAPIRDHTGAIAAAANISVPGGRLSVEEMRERLVPALTRAAAAIGRELGEPPGTQDE